MLVVVCIVLVALAVVLASDVGLAITSIDMLAVLLDIALTKELEACLLLPDCPKLTSDDPDAAGAVVDAG